MQAYREEEEARFEEVFAEWQRRRLLFREAFAATDGSATGADLREAAATEQEAFLAWITWTSNDAADEWPHWYASAFAWSELEMEDFRAVRQAASDRNSEAICEVEMDDFGAARSEV